MSKGLSAGLLVLGIILIVVAIVLHFALAITVFPHFTVILGVVGVIVAAAGAWGYFMQKPAA